MNNRPDNYGKQPPRHVPARGPYRNIFNFTKEELEEKKQRAIAEEAEKKKRKAEMQLKKVVEEKPQKMDEVGPSDYHIEEKRRKVDGEIRMTASPWVQPSRAHVPWAPPTASRRRHYWDFTKEELEEKKQRAIAEEAEKKKRKAEMQLKKVMEEKPQKMSESLQAGPSYHIDNFNLVTPKWEEEKKNLIEEEARKAYGETRMTPSPWVPPSRTHVPWAPPTASRKRHYWDFTQEELEEKKQKAIAEEAEKKAKKLEMDKIKKMNNRPDNYGKQPPRYVPARGPYRNIFNFTKEELEEKKQRAIAEEAEKKRRKAELQLKKVVEEKPQKMSESLQAGPSYHIDNFNLVTPKWEEEKKNLIEEEARKAYGETRMTPSPWVPPSRTHVPWAPPTASRKRHYWDFTQEELEEKKQKAIAEEAEKKAKKLEMDKIKNESRWIEIGRAFCDIKPEDLLLEESAEDGKEEASGVEIVSNVHSFVENFKRLMGDQAKGTVFGNCNSLTGALCGVNQRSVVYIDERIEKMKKNREEAARREAQEKERQEERWIEIGRAMCSLTPEDVGIEDSEGQKAPDAPTTSESAVNTELVSGEDVLANVYHFSAALRDLMGVHAKHTCLRSPFEFTSVFANVAEKSVRDRHPIRKIGKSKYTPDNL